MLSPLAAMDDPLRRGAAEQRKAEAASLLQKGDGAGAYDLYRMLAREYPEDDSVLLGLARAAITSRRWNQAVLAYEMLLVRHPGDAGLYGELANIYMMIGDRAAAERSLNMRESLTGAATGGPSGLLDELDKRYGQFQIHGKVRAGLMYDSNVNMGTDSDILDLGNWRVHAPDARRRESFGAYLGADLDLGWRPLRDGDWWLVGDVRGLWRGHENASIHDRLRARESQWGRAAAGLRRLSAETLLDMRIKAEIFDYEWYQNVSAFGPELTFLWAATPSLQLISRGGIDRRLYSRDPDRNGAYYSLGQYARVFFSGRNHEFTLGAQYRGGAPDRHDYAYDGWEVSARLLFKLPYELELAPSASYGKELYKGPATALETKNRRDERLRLGADLTYRINESWALELSYQYVKNNSASDLYDYKQHYVSAGVAWSF
jgi:hypothetical protein